MADRIVAKEALDSIIRKSRVHLYKPIQIAEILFHYRVDSEPFDLLSVDNYRNKSKKWRDDISKVLLGRVCTSSARFQDDLFNENAIPPIILNELGKENLRTDGAVEAYIYSRFTNKQTQLADALKYATSADKENFDVKTFIDAFWNEPGLKRSIDKVYEIVVYALFSTLISALELKVEVSIAAEKRNILIEFSDFAQKVMCITNIDLSFSQDARVFRVGVTNAADRGLDMYSNWGPAIQIKHLSLDESLAEEIVTSVSSNKIVIICKDVEEKTIVSLLSQIGWRNRIQSIVTESNLISWYEKALRGTYGDIIGSELLTCLCGEISNEFPSLEEIPDILVKRGYDKKKDPFWL